MAYPSIDEIQKLLADDVFNYAKDSKKAAGRALGTIVEIITFYSLKSWGFEHNIAIERPLPEYSNPEITHNVEYSLHPSKIILQAEFEKDALPLTAKKIIKANDRINLNEADYPPKGTALLTKKFILKNSCTICNLDNHFLNVYLKDFKDDLGCYTIASLAYRPFAIFECKRVGVEDGMRKGPQTIEKAKQGAYVAKTVSSLQKVRLADGRIGGFIHKPNDGFICKDYYALLSEVIASDNSELLSNFILTVGVVSNHGNWFTSENQNKEMKVLAQSYDWLLFLTDYGIAQFVDELLLNPNDKLKSARESFLASYTGERGVNEFTKVKIALSADKALQSYFLDNQKRIENWFNIITPSGKELSVLQRELNVLKNKNWEKINNDCG